jgi:hypothetical protein
MNDVNSPTSGGLNESFCSIALWQRKDRSSASSWALEVIGKQCAMRAKRLMRCVFHLNNALSARIERQRNSFNMRIEPAVAESK